MILDLNVSPPPLETESMLHMVGLRFMLSPSPGPNLNMGLEPDPGSTPDRFAPELSEEEIVNHFETEANLHERMPELIPSRAHWGYSKNESGPLNPETDCGEELNHGSEWIVAVWLKVGLGCQLG